jgi:hypothetical protein
MAVPAAALGALLMSNVSGCAGSTDTAETTGTADTTAPEEHLGEASQALIDCTTSVQNLALPDPDDPSANGWTPVGSLQAGTIPPEFAPNPQTKGNARVFTWSGGGGVQCVYIRRNFPVPVGSPPPVATASANEVLCFDANDCSACAWEKDTKNVDPDPKGTLITDMPTAINPPADPSNIYDPNPTPQEFTNCSSCHVMGPIMPRQALLGQVGFQFLGLMDTCASAGGPKWLNGVAGWAAQKPGTPASNPPGDVLPAGDCGGCHSGFLKLQPMQSSYCAEATATFSSGGSMQGYFGGRLYLCKYFYSQIGCDPNVCDTIKANGLL